MGVPKQRLWVSSGAGTAENSQLYMKKNLYCSLKDSITVVHWTPCYHILLERSRYLLL